MVEKSAWRIPSWHDMNHLHHMVYGDEASVYKGLDMKPTGMIKSPDGISTTHQNPSYGIFWCSDFAVLRGIDTYHLFAHDSPDHSFLFQYQLQYPYAPIRLVQDVEPIQ